MDLSVCLSVLSCGWSCRWFNIPYFGAGMSPHAILGIRPSLFSGWVLRAGGRIFLSVGRHLFYRCAWAAGHSFLWIGIACIRPSLMGVLGQQARQVWRLIVPSVWRSCQAHLMWSRSIPSWGRLIDQAAATDSIIIRAYGHVYGREV